MKKTLKKQAREAEKKILEGNKDFYNEIVNQYFPQKKTKSKRRLVLQVSSIAAACLILITAISVLLFNVLKEDKVEYLFENEAVEDLNFNDFQNAAPWFPISQDYTYQVTRTYDSLSGDNLYFVVNMRGTTYAETININLYINPNYNFSGELLPNVQQKEIKGIVIRYNEEISQNSYGLYDFSYKANYRQGENEVFIRYEQTWIDENTHFFAFLEEIIN